MASRRTTAPPTNGLYDPVPQQFNLVHGLTISNDGIVYVADRNNNRVQAFTLEGKFLKEALCAGNPDGGVRHGEQRGAVRRQGATLSLCLAKATSNASGCWTARHCRRVRKASSAMWGPSRACSWGRISSPLIPEAISIRATDGDGRVQKSIFKGVSL